VSSVKRIDSDEAAELHAFRECRRFISIVKFDLIFRCICNGIVCGWVASTAEPRPSRNIGYSEMTSSQIENEED